MAAITEIPQVNLIDFDVYGRSSSNGGALIHSNDFAISNAIIFFLTSGKGDFLYNPIKGGIMQNLLFKLLDQKYITFYQTQISEVLKSEFGALITNIVVDITSNFQNRYYEVKILYTSKQTEVVNQVEFYTKPIIRETSTIIFIDINLTGDNLLAFVLLQKGYPDQAKFKLELNDEDNKWYWGRFKFNLFDDNSENFQEIFDTING